MPNRIIAYCPIHYGAEYLEAAIKSVEPFVEKIIMLYTEKPSYGFGTDRPCPESQELLKLIALQASPKVQWEVCAPGDEGHHRGLIMNYAQDYDGVLAFDADEVFDQVDLPVALELCFQTDKRYIGFGGYINFWKSFNYACYDGFTPIRFINLRNHGGQGVVSCKVYHFSTAQKDEIMRYKLEIHGHKDEIRAGWFDLTYQLWTPENNFGDLHLVAIGLWNATPFDKTTMPQILKDHPNYNKELIG